MPVFCGTDSKCSMVENEQTVTLCNNMNESVRYKVEKKSDTKEDLLYNPLCRQYKTDKAI